MDNMTAPYITSHLVCIANYEKKEHCRICENYDFVRKLIPTSFVLVLVPASSLTLFYVGGLVWGNLSGKAQRLRAQVRTCLLTVISLCPWRGQGAVPHQGVEGGDWNVTAECQTLCPDGIITDSSEAALYNSASSLPQNFPKTGKVRERITKGVRSWVPISSL